MRRLRNSPSFGYVSRDITEIMSRINLWEAWPVSSCKRRLTGRITSHKLQRFQQGKYLVGGLIRTRAYLWVVAFFQGATFHL